MAYHDMAHHESHLCRWDTIEPLTHHTTPVLSLCTVPLPGRPSCNSHPSSCSTATQSAVPSTTHSPHQNGSSDHRAPLRDSEQVIWSGATNGCLAAWLVGNSSGAELQQWPHSNQQQQQQQAQQNQEQQHQPQQQQQQEEQKQQQQHSRMLWSTKQWHQSGINAMHAAHTPGVLHS